MAWLKEHGASLDTKNKFGTPVIFEIAQHELRDLLGWFVRNGAYLGAVDDREKRKTSHALNGLFVRRHPDERGRVG